MASERYRIAQINDVLVIEDLAVRAGEPIAGGIAEHRPLLESLIAAANRAEAEQPNNAAMRADDVRQGSESSLLSCVRWPSNAMRGAIVPVVAALCELRDKQEEQIATLTRRVEELEGALRWYADKHNYHTYGENICDKDLLIELDEGERARAALAAKGVKP